MQADRQNGKRISVVIPALNEEDGIEETINTIPGEELERMGYEVQIVVVDNGSTDRTGELARKSGAEVVLEPKRGYGSAFKAGFARAKGDVIATADADTTYPVQDIPRLVQILNSENLDFVTTDRFTLLNDGVMSFRNRMGNKILSLVMRLLFRLNIRDSQSGMWVFRSSLLDKMVLRFDSMAFSEEIKIEACRFPKSRWKEIPIEYGTRLGKTKLRSWRDGLGNLLGMAKKRIAR